MLKHINHGPVLELSIDRPPVNALNPALVEELSTAIRDAGETHKALVISGREGLFSAGLDIVELQQLDKAGIGDFWKHFIGLLEVVARSRIPIAAAINGHCPAGGAVLTLFCDYRVLSRGEFVIGLNETAVGLLVPGVIRYALIRAVGAHQAERLIVAGALINPEQALKFGLIDHLSADPASSIEDAVNWCAHHLTLPSESMLGNRSLMRKDLHQQFDALGDIDTTQFVDWWFEDHTQKTLDAVLEKLKKKR
jgi:enoyl-CoA hydratase/carnithine racemase